MDNYIQRPVAPAETKAKKYDGDYDHLRDAAATAGSVDAFEYKEHDKSITIAEGVELLPGQYLIADTNGAFSVEDAEAFEGKWMVKEETAA